MSFLGKMLRVALPLLLSAFVISCLLSTNSSAQTRKRIAVVAFDDSTAGTQNENIGAKVADVLISKLAATGAFEIVDREHLNQLLTEQNNGKGSRFDPSGAAHLGKLANVEAVVFGQVAAFNSNIGTETKNRFVASKQTSVGTVELKVTARLINVETSSILLAPAANVEKKEVLSESTSTNLVQGVSSNRTVDVQAALMKLVDKSVDEISQSLATQLAAASGSIPSSRGSNSVLAKVVGLDNGAVLVNKGTNAGIKVGDKFAVVRSVDTGLKDPDTGKAVTRRKKICALAISETEDSLSSGQCQGEVAQAGDELAPAQ